MLLNTCHCGPNSWFDQREHDITTCNRYKLSNIQVVNSGSLSAAQKQVLRPVVVFRACEMFIRRVLAEFGPVDNRKHFPHCSGMQSRATFGCGICRDLAWISQMPRDGCWSLLNYSRGSRRNIRSSLFAAVTRFSRLNNGGSQHCIADAWMCNCHTPESKTWHLYWRLSWKAN